MGFVVRTAVPEDYDGIADAHMDSIRTLGATQYDADIVNDWAAARIGEDYARRVARGAKLFVAVEKGRILGFSDYRVVRDLYRTAIYVRASAARRGVGSELFKIAETAARANGATKLYVEASLVAVLFYIANGFEEVGSSEHVLQTGRTMPCVRMCKHLKGLA